MNIGLLGAPDSTLLWWLQGRGHNVIVQREKITLEWCQEQEVVFLVSYNYQHIIPSDITGIYDGRAVNLHISYLPYNRGAHPNVWAFVDGTPKGVSIHYINAGLDTGDLIAQERIHFLEGETLRTTYAFLHDALRRLFKATWKSIVQERCPRVPQEGPGTFHRKADLQLIEHVLTQGWDTPVKMLEEYGADLEMARQDREKYVQEVL